MRMPEQAGGNAAGEQPQQTMYTVSEVAKRLGVSLSFAHKLVRSGKIQSYRFGRCRRVSEAQIESYLEASRFVERDRLAERKLRFF